MLGSPEMAVVKPFRAERYDEQSAGPLEQLVAPPYDVISPEERSELPRPQPVQRRPPDPAGHRGRGRRCDSRTGAGAECSRATRSRPTGSSRRTTSVPTASHVTRSGLVASLRAEPYENRVVLPHERTHSGPKEGRLRLLRATRTQLEPIFLLYEGDPLEPPAREPDLQSGGDRLWRIGDAPSFEQTELLIADGHHRYETALAYAQEGGSPYLMVVLVPTRAGRADDLSDAPRRGARQRRGGNADRRAGRRASRRRSLPRRPVRAARRRRARRRHRRANRTAGRDVHVDSEETRSQPSTAATQRPRSCSGPRASRTCGRLRGAATRCRRRARTSFPS